MMQQQVVERAFAHLPGWVQWGPYLVHTLLVFVGAWGFTKAYAWWRARHWRRAGAEATHWTERARLLYPLRRVGGLTWVFPVLSAGAVLWRPVDFRWATYGFAAGVACVAWVGMRAAFFSELRKTPLAWLVDRETVRARLTRVAVRYPHIAAGVVMLAGCPPEWNGRTFGLAAGFAVVYLFAASHAHLGLLAGLGIIERASPPVRELADQEARAVGTQVDGVYVAPLGYANALAFPLMGSVVVSRRLVELLSREELRQILAHEMAHLAETPAQKAIRMVPALAFFPVFLAAPIFAAYSVWGFLAIGIWLFVVPRVFGPFSRRMETAADRRQGSDSRRAAAFGRALESICRYNLVPAASAGGRTASHPDLYRRLARLRRKPDYARPDPPPAEGGSRWAAYAGFLGLVVVLVAPGLVVDALPGGESLFPGEAASRGGPPTPQRHRVRMAIAGVGAKDLRQLGKRAGEAGRWEEALDFYGACVASRPAPVTDLACRSLRVVVAARLGRCEQARRWNRTFAINFNDFPDDVARELLKIRSQVREKMAECRRLADVF